MTKGVESIIAFKQWCKLMKLNPKKPDSLIAFAKWRVGQTV